MSQLGRDLLLDHPTQGSGTHDFHDLDAVADRLWAFERYWQHTGTPFDWKFTRTDLNNLLARINAHEPLPPQPDRYVTALPCQTTKSCARRLSLTLSDAVSRLRTLGLAAGSSVRQYLPRR